tara:strand:+ start:2313 stop:2678 length:366 start_codon:yes stop_codon:yes gene_type:complete
MPVQDDFKGHTDRLDAIIFSDDKLGLQLRMTVTEFMGRYYMGVRKYFLSFEGEWLPTKTGVSWEYNLETSTNMFGAFTEILSEAEVLAAVAAEHEKIKERESAIESRTETSDPSVQSGTEG